jgi:hypothetical protein
LLSCDTPAYLESDTKICYNGAKSWQLGWYADKRRVDIDVPVLDDPDDPEESGDLVIIKVETGSDEDYFIIFVASRRLLLFTVD